MTGAAQGQARHPSLPPLAVPEGAGVNIHFTDARAGEMKMLAEGGFRYVRMDLSWGGTEREKGVYDFSAFDRLVKSLDEYKIRALFILDYSNRHYDEGLSPYTDAGRAAMAKWAAAAAVHFRGRGILWEMYNEPNISFWKPKPNVNDYILLDKAVAAALRKAAPGECYFGAATSTVDLNFLEACFKSGALERWDAVSVHPYRQTDPETSAGEYRKLRLLIDTYKPKGKEIPILSGEWGYSTVWGSFDDERQGKYLPRQWMTNLMNEVPLSIWYDWHDDGEDPKEAEHNFGSVKFKYNAGRDPIYDPKPSYTAARTFTQFFRGYAFNKRLSLQSPDDYLLLFSNGKDVKLAAWTTKAAHEITIPTSPGAFRVTNYLGVSQGDKAADRTGLKLSVSDKPLYIESEAPNAILRGAAAWKRVPLDIWVKAPNRINVPSPIGKRTIFIGRDALPQSVPTSAQIGGVTLTQTSEAVVINPLTIALFPSANNQLTARLENPSGTELHGKVSVNGEAPQPVGFAAGETEKTVLLPRPAANADGSWQASLRFEGGKEDVVQTTRSFRPHDDFGRHGDLSQAYKVTPDGDAKIVSEQSLSVAQPPGGPSPSGAASLKLTYRFEPGWKFVQVQPLTDTLKTVQGQPKALGLWIYGDGSENVIRMRFRDSTGQTFQPNGTVMNWKGWRYYEFPIDNTGGIWGGAKDSQIHWPIQVDTLFLFDSKSFPVNKGDVYISSPVWVY